MALPTTDKYEAVAAMRTDGANYGLETADIIAWLKALEGEQPFKLFWIKHDLLSGRFTSPVAEPEELAERMYAFCPGIVDQGCGSVDAFAEELRDQGRLFFWWD